MTVDPMTYGGQAHHQDFSVPRQSPDGGDALRYAVIGDSHIDPFSPEHSQFARDVFAWLEEIEPQLAFILHVGDITQCGWSEQFNAYDAAVPERLRGRILHVPGNHEVRWDAGAGREFAERFKPPPFSCDIQGLHVVALDPTTLLQESGHFGADQLAWLDADLAAAGEGTPSVIFFHFPVGGSNYFIVDQDAFYEVIAPYNVAGIHVGHVHRDEVLTINGFTQVSVRALRNGPFLHLVDRIGDFLEVRTVEVNADGADSELLVTIPLSRDRRFPIGTSALIDGAGPGAGIRVDLQEGLTPAAMQVEARMWPNHIYAGIDHRQDGWLELVPEDRGNPSVWSGSNACGVVPGHDRLEVRARDIDGSSRQWAVPVEVVTCGDLLVLWEHRVGEGAVQAGLATDGNRVIVATTSGEVVSYRVGRRGPTEAWRHSGKQPGDGVIGTPCVGADGRVYAGARSGRLVSLRADTGEIRWETALDAPIVGSPAWSGEGDQPLLFAPAGDTLYALNPDDGAKVWAAGLGGVVGGRPAGDDRLVYVSSGDGMLRAIDRQTGAEVWSSLLVRPDIPFRQLISSAWAHHTMLLPGSGHAPETVLAATVTRATAHDRATGEVMWDLPGGFMYAGPVRSGGPGETLILSDERGVVTCVDVYSGRVVWTQELGCRVLGTSLQTYKGLIIVAGTGGQVSILEMDTGTIVGRMQAGGTSVLGAPVIVGDLLIVGGQDRQIRAIDLAGVGKGKGVMACE